MVGTPSHSWCCCFCGCDWLLLTLNSKARPSLQVYSFKVYGLAARYDAIEILPGRGLGINMTKLISYKDFFILLN